MTFACRATRSRIFEALPVLGGMLRVGIPDYRLPPDILDREIGYLLRHGIDARTGMRLGTDFHLADLTDQGYGAVFLAVGAHSVMTMNVPGEDTPRGVIDAIAFLRETSQGDRQRPGRQVAVVGGGNVAIDAARTAKRLGAERVTVVYRRSEQEMPAYAEEVQGAREEGIEFATLAAPVRILATDGRVVGFECIRTRLGPPDDSGRRRPVPVEGSEFVIDCDAVIPAIGQRTDMAWTKKAPDLDLTARHTVAVNRPDHADLHCSCICRRRRGGRTGHRGRGGSGRAQVQPPPSCNFCKARTWTNSPTAWKPGPPRAATGPPSPMTSYRCRGCSPLITPRRPGRPPSMRWRACMDEAAARQEAARCLNCGTCCECMACVSACEAKAIDHTMQPPQEVIQVGSIILATGIRPAGPHAHEALRLRPLSQRHSPAWSSSASAMPPAPPAGRSSCVTTTGEFTDPPQSVALVHCVGSRDVNYHEYCSRVCCMYALKYSSPDQGKGGPRHAQVYDFYIDQRCFGKGYEEFYRRCQEEGTVFIRGKVAEITDQALQAERRRARLVAMAEDTLLGETCGCPWTWWCCAGHGGPQPTPPMWGGASASTRAPTASSWKSTPSWGR
jgi:heterodisulfide reductase subunit A